MVFVLLFLGVCGVFDNLLPPISIDNILMHLVGTLYFQFVDLCFALSSLSGPAIRMAVDACCYVVDRYSETV